MSEILISVICFCHFHYAIFNPTLYNINSHRAQREAGNPLCKAMLNGNTYIPKKKSVTNKS